MGNIEKILKNNNFYTLSGNYQYYSFKGNSSNSDVQFIFENNKGFKKNRLELCLFTDIDKLTDELSNNPLVSSLFIDSFAIHDLKQLNGYSFEFIYCDLTDFSDMLQQYEIWCQLRKLTKFLLIKANVYGEIKYLDYNFDNPIEVSVIYPVYNVSQYLEQCFANFLAFPHQFVEFLAVNDGSTDNSPETLEKLQKTDPRLKILNKPNGGCASARMCGLKNATGRYVAFIDPDDFVEPDFLLKLHMNAVFSGCQVIQCGYRKFYMETNLYLNVADGPGLAKYFQPQYSERDPIYELCQINEIAIWRRLYLRDFLLDNQIEFPVLIKRFDDLPFFFEVCARCVSFVAFPDKLYNYRLNRPGQDVAINDERLYVHFEIFTLLDKFYREKTGGNRHVLKNLLIARIHSHLWALNLLNKKYYSEYVKRMIADFTIHKKNLISSLSVIKVYYGFKPIATLLFLGILLRSKWLITLAVNRYKKKQQAQITN